MEQNQTWNKIKHGTKSNMELNKDCEGVCGGRAVY